MNIFSYSVRVSCGIIDNDKKGVWCLVKKKKKGLSIGLTIGVIVILFIILPEQMGGGLGAILGTIENITHSFILAVILTLLIVGGIIYLLYFGINYSLWLSCW